MNRETSREAQRFQINVYCAARQSFTFERNQVIRRFLARHRFYQSGVQQLAALRVELHNVTLLTAGLAEVIHNDSLIVDIDVFQQQRGNAVCGFTVSCSFRATDTAGSLINQFAQQSANTVFSVWRFRQIRQPLLGQVRQVRHCFGHNVKLFAACIFAIVFGVHACEVGAECSFESTDVSVVEFRVVRWVHLHNTGWRLQKLFPGNGVVTAEVIDHADERFWNWVQRSA